MNIPDRRLEEAARFLDWVFDKCGVLPVIAGGFVRDGLLGGPARDIDMYISDSDWYTVLPVVAKTVEGAFGIEYVAEEPEVFEQHQDEYKHQSIQRHLEFNVNNEVLLEFPLLFTDRKLDLIGLRNDTEVIAEVSGDEIVSRFNIGLSQAYILMDGQGWIAATSEAFDEDRQFQTITVLRTDWGQEATAKSMDKLMAKYPHFIPQFRDGTEYNKDKFLRTQYKEVTEVF